MTAARKMVDRVDHVMDMYFDGLTALVGIQRTWAKTLLLQPMSLTPVQETVSRLADYASDGVAYRDREPVHHH